METIFLQKNTPSAKPLKAGQAAPAA